MKAVLLAGGLGTRISEETDLKPKPMVEIGGKPILWHIMKNYSAHGINEFIIHYAYNANTGRDFRMLPSQDGSSFSVSNTECIRFRTIFESGSAGSGHANAINLGVWRTYLNIGAAADDPITARIQVAHPYDSDKRTIFMTDAGGRDPSNYYREMASGNPTSAGRTYGARFQAESGNTNAKVSLYGIKYA